MNKLDQAYLLLKTKCQEKSADIVKQLSKTFLTCPQNRQERENFN